MGEKSGEEHYEKAGVSIDRGNAWVDAIKPLAASTNRKGVVSGVGGFAGLFRPDWKQYEDPILLSGTDGVGTKLKVAEWANRHDSIGIDLVAMCVNDIVVMGAEPLYFLDYYASGRLDLSSGKAILEGIAEGCRQAGAALLGGETAEMPGVYPPGGYDLAGFAVGIADRKKIVDGKQLEPGHAIYGIASTGVHSNGFSLVRKVLIEDGAIKPQDPVPFDPEKSWADLLLAPTRIYVSLVLELLRRFSITGLVHVTGGGITENVPRILPKSMSARINPRSWPRPALFSDLQERGSVTSREMFRVFNMGIGLVIMIPPGEKEMFEKFLSDQGESWYLLGEIIPGGGEVVYDRSF